MEPTQQVGPMPTEQRAELQRLAEAATPGPWRVPSGTILVMTGPPLASALEIASCETAIDAFANVDYIAAASPDVVLGLLQQLAAAEARATEAAAEAGKWQAEARAHAARCAVLEKAEAAPYCEGQCGICDCQAEPAWSQQRACPNCQSTDWQELAPGFGCNQCQGL